jgi:glucoamylase
MAVGDGAAEVGMRDYGYVQAAPAQSDLPLIARYLLPLMLRNVASDGFVFTDPADPTRFSAPGCVIASPSFDRNLDSIRQNYVFNWTRDAAVTALEIAAAQEPVRLGSGSGPLEDYVAFAQTCQQNGPTLARACFTIEGQPRDWTDQNDGPALRTVAILAAFAQLDAPARATALAVMQRDVEFVMQNYREPGYNLWEEVHGQSFFTRSVQLRCLREARANTVGLAVPAGIDDAIGRLAQALAGHWSGQYYTSILDATDPREGYDPNIDVVMAAVYGAVECTDPKVLATAALLRERWADPASATRYPINAADAASGVGPLVGRYPGDVYDGDLDTTGTAHPWALCTANFAELYYRVAAAVRDSGAVPGDDQSGAFLAQVGVAPDTAAQDAVASLVAAGDAMLHAVVRHSDHLELSEQFDAVTGYEKSVRNLTWSYAAVLSAVRARGTVATS